MSSSRKALLAILMVPLAVLLTLGSISLASANTSGHVATHQLAKKPKIVISSFTFTVPKRVKAGATIKVINKDAAPHTVTSDDGTTFDVAVPAHSTVKFKAPAAGKYPFHCSVHPTMKSKLVVR